MALVLMLVRPGIAQFPQPSGSHTLGYTGSMSKVMVSLPEDLLAAVDREAKRRATTRSALLALAVRRELSRRDPDEVAAAVARSEQRFEQAGVFESTDIIRRARDSGR